RDLARSRFATVRQLLDHGMGGAEAVLLRRWVDFAQAEVAFLDQDFPAAVAYTNAYLSQVPDGAEGYALKGACLKFLGQQEAGEDLRAGGGGLPGRGLPGGGRLYQRVPQPGSGGCGRLRSERGVYEVAGPGGGRGVLDQKSSRAESPRAKEKHTSELQ